MDMKRTLKRFVLGIILFSGLGGAVRAQGLRVGDETSGMTSLVGRTYRSGNMLMEMMKKEGGGKLSEELKDPEKQKELKEKMEKAMSMYTTVIFKTDATLTMKSTAYCDDDLMKQAGVGWAKRKLLKLAFKAMNHEEEMPYRVQGSLVIAGKADELDTLRLSADGKQLTMKMTEKKKTETVTMVLQ